MKNKLEWLNRDLLTSPYCYALCLSQESFDGEMKRLKIPKKDRPDFQKTAHANATVHFFEAKNAERCAIVCMGSAKGFDREQIYALLVHEAVHIWQRIRESIGETYPGDETEAYAIQRLAQSLMFSYKEQTGKSKK